MPAASAIAQPRTTSELVVFFMKSVTEVLSTMVGISVTIGKPHTKLDPTPSYDVSGIIGFSGDVMGSMVLSFDSDTATALASNFAGTRITPDNPDFPDAIGELANMIAGAAKKSFGTLASISVPSVIIGPGHRIARLQDVPCIVIPCSTPVGSFAVEVNIKPTAMPSKGA